MLKYLFTTCISITALLGQATADEPSHQGVAYSWNYPSSCAEVSSWGKIAAYKIASYLTDPLTKSREYLIRAQILDELPPSSYVYQTVDSVFSYIKNLQLVDEKFLDSECTAKFAEKCFLYSGAAMLGAISPFTSAPAAALRFVTSNTETQNYIHYTTEAPEKQLPDTGTFSHIQWNICGIKAGYEIQSGAQMPIQDDLLPSHEYRIYKIAQKIIEEDADVVCLNEVFDFKDAAYLVDALQNHYPHFVVHCGPRTVGISSGLFFATKFHVDDVHFTPFEKVKDNLAAIYAEKGFLTVNTSDCKGSIAKMILTHMLHSVSPSYPTEEEMRIRKEEMTHILETIDLGSDEHVVLAGDLNLDNEELFSISPSLKEEFTKTLNYTPKNSEVTKTWLGDEWYIEFANKHPHSSRFFTAPECQEKLPVSCGVDLDHVLVKKPQTCGAHAHVETKLKQTGYDPKVISRDSLSDHMMLVSKITLKR